MRPLALSLLLLTACRGGTEDTDPVDVDGDASLAADDCNDDDAAVFPGATETCNGIDDDCDGVVDDEPTDVQTFYADVDGDGYGDGSAASTGCDLPAGHVTDATDCDDHDAAFHPGATEDDCTDPADYNCDGSVGYDDVDADGFAACEDCNDADAMISPDGEEVCDGSDNDCDGAVDEAGATGEGTWYADADSDGFGNALDAQAACDQPAGFVDNGQDCDDTSAAALPGGTEICDGLDNDCNGDVDDDATDASTWYADGDGDLFGNPSSSVVACAAPAGFVADATDCDDVHDAVNTGATEACNDIDDDCDGSVDEGFDADSDTWTSCAGDCDDQVAEVNPDATEACDDVDNDCNGLVDEAGATGEQDWYIDYDGDGHGHDAFTATACEAPAGYVASSDDCDDLDGDYNPSASLGCDGNDYDCDGSVDNDGDGDGYADLACGGTDCDDSDSSLVPEPGGGCALGTSCKDVLDHSRDDGDGVYTIDPDGLGTGEEPFDVYCNMSDDGGGWTLVYSHVRDKANKSQLFTDFADLSSLDVSPDGPDYKHNYRLALQRWNGLATEGEWLFRASEKYNGPSEAPDEFWTKITDVSLDTSDNYRARYGTDVTVAAEPECVHRDAWFSHVKGHRTTYCAEMGTWQTPSSCGGNGVPWMDACCWQQVLGTATEGKVTTNWHIGEFMDGNLFWSDSDSSQRCGPNKAALQDAYYEYVGLYVR